MNKNFVIINYNTQEFVDKLIMSINKFVDDAHIYVFDNSDHCKFINNFSNVNVIDNTNNQIIDFDLFLSKYPDRIYSSGKYNNFASAKHCYTVEKCIELFDDNFILLDSDVLLKKDVSKIFENNDIYVGEIITQPNGIKRVVPYFLFINVKYCKKYNIHFFDDQYMHGLSKGSSDMYDTGGAFFINTQGYNHLDINTDDYIVHYSHGSWNKTGYRYTISKEQFFDINEKYWKN